MTPEIAFVLSVLAVSLVLFITEKLRMDVVALLVLGVLAIGGSWARGGQGLISKEEALAGFSNPAVVTVWAMFILSAGLSATGVADVIGRQVLKLAGKTEPRMILAIMLTAGGLSAFMNNIGVAALMLPVVMDIARKTQTSPSRLLMPMAYGSLLGGLTTLIGTPPNLVASNALRQAGYEGFELFSFSAVGVPAMVVGALFVAFVGRHLLPSKMPEGMEAAAEGAGDELRFAHGLEDRRFHLRISADSPLDGVALKEAGLGRVLGLQVIGVSRGSEGFAGLGGDFVLRAGDLLEVQGRVGEFEDFLNWQALEIATGDEILQLLSSQKVGLMRAPVSDRSDLVGLTVKESDFNRRFGAHILTVRRGGKVVRDGLANLDFEAGDVLLLNGRRDSLDHLAAMPEFEGAELVSEEQLRDVYPKSELLMELKVPAGSRLVDSTVAESGLAESLGLRVIGIVRPQEAVYFPNPDEIFRAGDQLLVHGRERSLELIRAVQSLELVEGAEALPGAAGEEGYTEVTLAPQSSLEGKTLREVDFRRRYGLQVLSIWRGGRAYRSYLRNMKLEFGDALLLSGEREAVESLANDTDFLILSRSAYKEKAKDDPWKAILAASLMMAVVIPVILGWVPISIAAVAGSALMVASRCLTMEEAYKAIEWKSVFLIAGMIPLGTAMQTSGAAEWVAQGVSGAVAPFGFWGMLVGLYLLTSVATTIVPTTALVLIMAPIAIGMAKETGVSPHLMMMAIAMAASASFTSPISHPANVLVMGPGGYRFVDYIRMGVL
ncbi:MAG: SLC13 family permease, partial [Verrucomicrobiales bacterium]